MLRILKNILCIFVSCMIMIGVIFGCGTALLLGDEHAHFLGYKITENYTFDNERFYHIGNAILIKVVSKQELSHDTPIAYYDKDYNLIYVYRIVNSNNDNCRVVDNYGTIIPIETKNIIGKVIEK